MAATRIAVIGAGIAGLLAARRIADGGHTAVVVEKRETLGGRLATTRLAGARLDDGAQFFTVRGPEFRALADRWLAAGIAYEWCRGFDQPPRSPDGYPRYAGTGGMQTLAAELAAGLEVHAGGAVTAITMQRSGARLTLDDGTAIAAGGVVFTPPVPQALALLDAGGIALDPAERDALDAITYEPTIAVLAVLDRPSAVPPPGGVQPAGGAFSFVADNQAKGISDRPAVTLHAAGELSEARWDDRDDDLLADLLVEGRRWLGAEPVAAVLKRWRHARPVTLHPEAFLAVDGPVPCVFAGDGFKEARIEGAARSGWAAAGAVLDLLR
ncbi:MAG TPA: FAD-dependent oxidoreductase [Acidimicrobiales bacterium]|nr:FAD-dependent oxidoreductase [Acidimicrobiales bacterium]